MTTVSDKPLDHPYPERPFRLYYALTNSCNRACPWCSTYSSPSKSTWLRKEDYLRFFPAEGPFEVQLEGGEPTIHPDFSRFVEQAVAHPGCKRLVLCTNGVNLPREKKSLTDWLVRLGEFCTVKLSFNHHLLDNDPYLPELALLLRDCLDELGGERQFVLNVRLRKGIEQNDNAVCAIVESKGLLESSNTFFLQRYGQAADNEEWELPFLAGTNFRLVNPDGQELGTDLLARTEAMGLLI